MATEFEIYLAGVDEGYGRQAVQAAFAEADRLENELSRFLPNSDISRINHLQPGQTIVIGVDAMALLRASFQFYLQTKGAFDISLGGWYRCWLNDDKSLRRPSTAEIEQVGRMTGLHHLFFDEANFTVAVDVAGVELDLGAIGKGYAVDKMAGVLKEWGIGAALIHSGSSSVYAWGGEEGWLTTISHPLDHSQILRRLALQEMAMGGSGVQKGLHIIDPLRGRPVQDRLAAWVLAPYAASSDALSTAFMVMALADIELYCQEHPHIAAAIIPSASRDSELITFGLDLPLT